MLGLSCSKAYSSKSESYLLPSTFTSTPLQGPSQVTKNDVSSPLGWADISIVLITIKIRICVETTNKINDIKNDLHDYRYLKKVPLHVRM